jgi:hypothetical protein
MKQENTVRTVETTDNAEDSAGSGMRKSNLLLIGAGVIVFGFIIGDRLLDMLRVDDLPDTAAESARLSETLGSSSEAKQNKFPVETDSSRVGVTNSGQDVAEVAEVVEVVDVAEVAEVAEVEASALPSMEPGSVDETVTPLIEDVFGTRLVFVSQSEPVYVITANDQRVDLGANVDEETVLTGLTSDSVIVSKNGDLMVLPLPAPGESAQ